MIVDPRYQRGKIYTIKSYKTDLVYVGSTIEPRLSNRLGAHRRKFKMYKNDKYHYVSSFDMFEIDEDCYIELYEQYPCDNKEVLEKREGEVIKELDCVNKRVAGRIHKEWYQDNKQYKLEYAKQHYQNNKQHKLEYAKHYRDNHKQERAEYDRQLYVNNKQKIKARQSKSYHCDCGITITWGSKSRHFRSKKHKDYITFINN